VCIAFWFSIQRYSQLESPSPARSGSLVPSTQASLSAIAPTRKLTGPRSADHHATIRSFADATATVS
jgi:hypothetical protein